MNDIQPSTELGRLFAQLRAETSSGDPRVCVETMSGRTQQVEALRSESRFSGLALTIDEPVSFGGTGAAPNPAEVMLAALGASMEVTIRCYADFLGINVKSIGVELSAQMNSQGFFGTGEGVRSGFPAISATVKIVSDEQSEAISQLLTIAERCCPVLDNIRHPTEVALSFDLVKPSEV
ncbi:OsmC family protein [Mesorhizobium sp. WSM3224]|uniref:OsmC family protein n=1 Tax=Mesorhizobium sp. WSM3224 TaxID=1040986 RepID=UPI0018DB0276|nr:OsmC family protein [Mesorhizobium sp. WSM3224]